MSPPHSEAPSKAPGSTTSLRAANRRRVVDALRASGGGTQADLSRRTGLAAATVSNIVHELAANGLVTTEAGAGRRGTWVQLGSGAGVVAAVDFGHSHVGVALGDLTGAVLTEERRSLAHDYDDAGGLALAGRLLDDALRRIGRDRAAVRNVGMGLPAPISDGVVTSTSILPGWVGVSARAAAEERLGLPVLLDNDANLGALGEHRAGIGRGHRNVVYVKVSSGVGAGLVLDGRIFRGTNGMAGELGHLTLDEQGPLCRCGSRGCLEAYTASGPALALMGGDYDEDGIERVVQLAREGNQSARRVFEDAGLHLGWGLAMAINLLNPGVIALGGDMAQAGDVLLDAVRLGMRRHALAGAGDTPIEVAALGDRASLIGGLMLALDATDLATP